MKETTKHDWHRRVDEAVTAIMNALDEPIDFVRIAQTVASSPYHFHRKFHELTGESVHRCIRRLRLERGAYLLRNTGRPVTDIALDSGYETLESFTKAFKSSYTISPSEVRKLRSWDGLLYSQAGIHYGCEKDYHWFYVAGEGDDMETKIVNLPERRLIALENRGDPWGLPETWARFHQIARENNLYDFIHGYMSVFNESITATEEKLQYAAGIVDQSFQSCARLQELIVPEGLYAVIVHFGSCEEIGSTRERWLKAWLPDSGWEIDVDRPSFEWYQNNLDMPELLLTFYCTPIRRSPPA